MALPKLETPTYELTLPSTNETITYRPFLVKEHKIMMTLADVDIKELSRVITDIIDVCTFRKINVKKLANFDIEYIFLNLRSKSIGEIVTINVNCECGEKIKHEINLNDAKIVKDDTIDPVINLRNNIGITLRYPTFYEMFDLLANEDKTNIFKIVSKCIDNIFTDETVHTRNNFSDKDAEDFLQQLTKDEFNEVEQFFVKLPKIVQDINARCTKCDKDVETTLEGLQNFFQ
jgi:hypothetical protein|tara:strand:+ start:333 stop:1028 length:696 start_codon:yes stop_codon:yes gene_type:complete